MSVLSYPARRDLRAAAFTALVLSAACSDGATPPPLAPSPANEPIAVWSATPRVLDGKSYRVLELRQPLYLQPPTEQGSLVVGDAAHVRLEALRRTAGAVASVDHAVQSTTTSPGISLLGSSSVFIDNTVASFFTTSTINVANPDEYRLGLLSQSVEHSADKTGQPRNAPFKHAFKHGTDEDARIQTVITAWPGIDIGTRCPVSAAERADHHLDANKVDFWRFVTADPQTAGSTGFAEVQRPCFDAPGDFCNSLDRCGDHDSGDPSPGNGGSGAGTGTLVSGKVYSLTFSGWSDRYCWVTDQYDSTGRYLGTVVDWCNF